MTAAEQLRALHAADLGMAVPTIDHGRVRRRAHRVLALRAVRVIALAAASALVLFVAGAQLPVAVAGEPGDGGSDGGGTDGGGAGGDDDDAGDDAGDDDGPTDDDGPSDDGPTDDGDEEAPLPDLVVDIDASDLSAWILTVSNDGDGDAGPFVVELSPGEPLEFPDGLVAGGSTSEPIDPCDSNQAPQLRATVDPDDRVPETDETNNLAEHPCDPAVD